jgi:hypothetical protein
MVNEVALWQVFLQALVGKLFEKHPHRRPRRYGNNIKMSLREVMV